MNNNIKIKNKISIWPKMKFSKMIMILFWKACNQNKMKMFIKKHFTLLKTFSKVKIIE